MSTVKELKAKFFALDNSEQKTLMLGAVVVSLFILYSLIYKPLDNSVVQLTESNAKNQELLVWMKQSVIQLKGKGAGSTTGSKRGSRSLNEVINTSAANAKISISRSQPRDNNQYQIWLDKVAFNNLVDWLQVLTRDFGIAVNSINLVKTDTDGLVRVSITFQDFGR